MLGLALSEDGRWLTIIASQGWARSEVFIHDQTSPRDQAVPVVEKVDARFDIPHLASDRLYPRTNWDAPNYRIVAIDPTVPEPSNWQTVIAERPDRVIEDYVLAGGMIVTHEMEAATSRLHVYEMDGSLVRELKLTGLGSVTTLAGEAETSLVAVGYTSFIQPSCAFIFDVTTGDRQPLSPLPPAQGFDPDAVRVEQVHYPSKDGTAVSMFLVHRNDVEKNGQTPTILAGYGGFNIS